MRGLTCRDVNRYAGTDVSSDADQDGNLDADMADEMADMSFS